MKKNTLFSVIFLVSVSLKSQNWTWLRGDDTSGGAGSLGTIGIPSPANDPSARHGCASWVDAGGNLWLFGGEEDLGKWRNDLWKYDPVTNQWTWMRGPSGYNSLGSYGSMGVASAQNDPPAREFSASWTDPSGKFWLYGGTGPTSTVIPSPGGKLADLWMFDPATNMWTWMSGYNTLNQSGIYGTLSVQNSTSKPGGREGCATWVDNSGKLWLFGGRGYDTGSTDGFLNDLWRFDPIVGQWTWMGGSNQINQNAVFGTKNVPAPANIPGGREDMTAWVDANGDFWLFGGLGHTSAPAVTLSPVGRCNDLWRYDHTTSEWTWVNGSATPNPVGVYGTIGIAAATNVPGGRYGANGWIDGMKNLWVFGGSGRDGGGTFGLLNDMWKFDPLSGQWTWMKGTSITDAAGIYGTPGVTSSTNMPGARMYHVFWPLTHDHFWLFGGEGFDKNSTFGHLNDVWKFGPPCSPDSITTNSGQMICGSGQFVFNAHNQLPSGVSWYTVAAGGAPAGTGNSFTTAVLGASSGPSVYTFYAEANNCTVTPRAMISVTVNPVPVVQITGPSSVCAGAPFTFSASGASTYSWSNNATGAAVSLTAGTSAATFTVTGFDNGCQATATKSIQVMNTPSVIISGFEGTLCAGSTITLSVSGIHTYSWNTGVTGNSLVVTPASTTHYTVTATSADNCVGSAVYTQNVSPCTGITDMHLQRPVIFPNPGSGEFYLSGIQGKTACITLYNTLGQRVFDANVAAGIAVRTSLPAGVYIYNLASGGHTVQGRLVIE